MRLQYFVLFSLIILSVAAAGCISSNTTVTTTSNTGHTFSLTLSLSYSSSTSVLSGERTSTSITKTSHTTAETLSYVPAFISQSFEELKSEAPLVASYYGTVVSGWVGDYKYLENSYVLQAMYNGDILPYYAAAKKSYTLAFVEYTLENGIEFTLWGIYDRGVFVASFGNVIDFKYFVQELAKKGTIGAIYFAGVSNGKIIGVTEYSVTDFLSPQFFGDKYSFLINYYYKDTEGTFVSIYISASATGESNYVSKVIVSEAPGMSYYFTMEDGKVTQTIVEYGTTSVETGKHNYTFLVPEGVLYGFVPVYIGEKSAILYIQGYGPQLVVATLKREDNYYTMSTSANCCEMKVEFFMNGTGTGFIRTPTRITVSNVSLKSTVDLSDVQTIIRFIVSFEGTSLTSYLIKNFGSAGVIKVSNSYVTMTLVCFDHYVIYFGIFPDTIVPLLEGKTAGTYVETLYYPNGEKRETTTVISYAPSAATIYYSFNISMTGAPHIIQSGAYFPRESMISEIVTSNGVKIAADGNINSDFPGYMLPYYLLYGAVRSDSTYLYVGPSLFGHFDIMVLYGTLSGSVYVGTVYNYDIMGEEYSVATGTFSLSISS